MSLTPIFDATLADAPVNIWQASSIFPRPVGVQVQTFAPDFREYIWPDPTNLSFLRSAA